MAKLIVENKSLNEVRFGLNFKGGVADVPKEKEAYVKDLAHRFGYEFEDGGTTKVHDQEGKGEGDKPETKPKAKPAAKKQTAKTTKAE